MRVREVDVAFEEPLDCLVPGELDTVVAGDRPHRQAAQRNRHDMGDSKGMERLKFPDDAETGCAVVEGEQTVARVILSAVHQVGLPIADAAALPDDSRALADMPLVRLPDTFLVAVRDAGLGLEAQERLAALPLAVDPGIDRLVAEFPEVARALDVSGNLLGREPGMEQLFDMRLKHQIILDDERRRFCGFPPPKHHALRVLLEINAGSIGVAPYLASDGRTMLSQDECDVSARLAARVQSTNDLAFCQRQMRKFGFQTSYV